MNWHKSSIFGVMLFALALGSLPPLARTFPTYRGADGSQFIIGFFEYDSRAHLQIDGRAVTLAKRLTLSGSRYSGGGVTLKITRAGIAPLQHAKRAGAGRAV